MTEEEIIAYALKLLYAGEFDSLYNYYKRIRLMDFTDPVLLLRYIDFLSSANLDENYINSFFKQISEKNTNPRVLRKAYEFFLRKENYERTYEFLSKLIENEPENFNIYIDMIELCRNKMFDSNLAFTWYKRMNENCTEPVALSRGEEENWKSIALFFKKKFPDYTPKLFAELLSDKLIFNKQDLKVNNQEIYFILVDGSNLAYEYDRNSKKSAKAINLYRLVEFFERLRGEYPNIDYSILVDASLIHLIDKKSQLNKLIEDGYITQIPAGSSADNYLIEFFKIHPQQTLLISNDQFKDLLDKESKPNRALILSHKYPLLIIFEEIIIPNFPFPLKSRLSSPFRHDVKSNPRKEEILEAKHEPSQIIESVKNEEQKIKKIDPVDETKIIQPIETKENKNEEPEYQEPIHKETSNNVENMIVVSKVEEINIVEKRAATSNVEIQKINNKNDEKWLKRIALVYKEIELQQQQPNFGNLCQRIKDEFGAWNKDYPSQPKFADFIKYLSEKYKFEIVEKPKNNFILTISDEMLKSLIDSEDPQMKKYYIALLDEYISSKADQILGEDFIDKEKSHFNYFLTVAQIVHKMKKPICFGTVLEVINRYKSEEMRAVKYESILEVVANPKFKSILKRTTINGNTYLTVNLFGHEFFTEYLPKEIPCEFDIVTPSIPETSIEAVEQIEESKLNSPIQGNSNEFDVIEEEFTDAYNSEGLTISQETEASIPQTVEPANLQTAESPISQETEASIPQTVEPANLQTAESPISQETEASIPQTAEPANLQTAESPISQETEASIPQTAEPANLQTAESPISQETEASIPQTAEPANLQTAESPISQETEASIPQTAEPANLQTAESPISQETEASIPQTAEPAIMHKKEVLTNKETSQKAEPKDNQIELKIKKQILPKKPDLLVGFEDKELLWLVRILNVSQIVKRGGKEIGLTDLALSLLKIYGINAWLKDLPQYPELLVMIQDFSKKFDFVMKMTSQQDYIIFFSAQVLEIGRNTINYLLNKNKKTIEWKPSLLDFEFSIDEIVVINIMTELMDKMISESMLPIWRELKPRLQDAISYKKPTINISKGIEDFIEKLLNKGVIGFARINGEIILQLKKRMNAVGMFEDN